MGKANRSRKASHQKGRSGPGQTRGRSAANHSHHRHEVKAEAERLLLSAVDLLCCEDHEHCRTHGDETIALLAAQRGGTWCRTVDITLFEFHLAVLEKKCWPDGWQPADLARTAARELGPAARRCMIDLMAAQLRAYAPATIDQIWHDQLDDLDARVWWTTAAADVTSETSETSESSGSAEPAESTQSAERIGTTGATGPDRTDADYVTARAEAAGLSRADTISVLVRLLALLAGLPRLEPLTPLPGLARAGAANSSRAADRGSGRIVDEKLLTRVRALLAKAESTTFEAEAETFTAAAQAMMARHSIDEALLHRHDGRDEQRPGGIRIPVDNPYPEPKAMLLQQIAEANRCRTVWSKHLGFTTVLGFRGDTAWVALLYTSLLVQATAAMTKAGSKTTSWGTSRTRAFRAAFLESFAVRIGERLRRATQQAEAEAAETSASDLLPVLADRGKAVDDEVRRIFPDMTSAYRGSWNTTDREGWAAGRTAADLADLARSNAIGPARTNES